MICWCLLSCAHQYAMADENTAALDLFLKDLESYQADFMQTLSSEQGETLEISTGKVYMQNPGRYRWEYEQPYVQLLITDSETLWIYDKDLEQVTIKNVAGAIDTTPAAIISGKQNISELYVVNNMGVIDGFDWLELIPRDIESQYRSIRLGFDDNKLITMIMNDNLGQMTRIDFLKPERNKRFGGPLFTFAMPAGVDVIDERQLQKNKALGTPIE